jgi:hypothetical protein
MYSHVTCWIEHLIHPDGYKQQLNTWLTIKNNPIHIAWCIFAATFAGEYSEGKARRARRYQSKIRK